MKLRCWDTGARTLYQLLFFLGVLLSILCGRNSDLEQAFHWAPTWQDLLGLLVPSRSTWLQVGYLAGKVYDPLGELLAC